MLRGSRPVGIEAVITAPSLATSCIIKCTPERGATRQGMGVVFTAFDRVWLLVGLTLALVVSWTTLLDHLAIKLP